METVTWILRSLNCRKAWSLIEQPEKKKTSKPETTKKPLVEIHIRDWGEIGDPLYNTKAFWMEKRDDIVWESNFEVKLDNSWGFLKHWENNSVEQAESFSAGQYTEADQH